MAAVLILYLKAALAAFTKLIEFPLPERKIKKSLIQLSKVFKKKISSDKPRCNSYSNRRAHWLCSKEILRKK